MKNIKEKVLKRLIKEQIVFQVDIDNGQVDTDWEVVFRETLAEVGKVIDDRIKKLKGEIKATPKIPNTPIFNELDDEAEACIEELEKLKQKLGISNGR